MNQKFYVFRVVLLLSLLSSSESNSSAFISNLQAVNACATVDCGQGICRTDSSLLGFECDCYPGWNNLLNFSFTSCIIPNCESLMIISALVLFLCFRLSRSGLPWCWACAPPPPPSASDSYSSPPSKPPSSLGLRGPLIASTVNNSLTLLISATLLVLPWL